MSVLCRTTPFRRQNTPPIPHSPAKIHPQISRTQVDHSCEGRNLTMSCPTTPKSTNNLPYTSRPFLRRQESIQTWAASPPKLRRLWRHTIVRFLPTQEWSSVGRKCAGIFGGENAGGRKCVGIFGGENAGGRKNRRHILTLLSPLPLPPRRIHHSPAIIRHSPAIIQHSPAIIHI